MSRRTFWSVAARVLPAQRPIGWAAGAAAVLIACGAAAGRVLPSSAPVHHSRPTIIGPPVVGQTLLASSGRWSGARSLSYRWERCGAAGARCKAIRAGRPARTATGRIYVLTRADAGHRIRVVVRGKNGSTASSVTSAPTAVVRKRSAAGHAGAATNPTPAPPGTAPDPGLMTLVSSSGDGAAPAGLPRPDAVCAAAVTPSPEKRPSNTTANHSVPADPAAIQWNPGWHWWPGFVAERRQVTGDFEGTTDEIIQWAACKWGIDVDVALADAWLESGWYMSTQSGCSGPEASFGLFQVVAEDCAGDPVHGGWPYVQDDTALNADYWGSWIRGCLDGAFLVAAQPWQNSPAQGYLGQPMSQVVAQHGEDYALWGCIGAWFSNSWYSTAAQGYIATVQKDEAAKPWLQPGT